MKCPACQSEKIVHGCFHDQMGEGLFQYFRPNGLKMLTLTGAYVRIPGQANFRSCLHCGLLWCKLDREKLKAVLIKSGTKDTKERLGLA